MNIALIGPRGSGKTKISIHLSKKLKLPILCLDALISYEEDGKPIPEIVSEHNGDWRYFRDVEYMVLEKSSKLDNIILDCGGGIIIDVDENGEEFFSKRKVELLREKALVFFLHPPVDSVARKIAGDKNRPSLSETKSAEKIFNDRLPHYQRASHYEIMVDRGERKDAAMEILNILQKEAKNFFME